MFTNLFKNISSVLQSLFESVIILGYGWGLVLVSAVAGAALVFLYKHVSAQATIAETKKQIGACILESVLFRHDIRTSLFAQGRAFFLGLKYAALAVPALVILAIPAILVLGQLYPYYAVAPVQAGSSATVTVALKDVSLLDSTSLEGSSDLEVVGPVRMPESQEVSWKVVRLSEKQQQEEGGNLVLKVGDQTQAFKLKENKENAGVGLTDGILDAWLYGATIVPVGLRNMISNLSVHYEDAAVKWLGISWNWLVLFLVISMIAGIGMSKIAKIEI